jgi:hypothetical protein
MQYNLNDVKNNISRLKRSKDSLRQLLYQIKYDNKMYKDDVSYKKLMEDISELFDDTPIGKLKAQMILLESNQIQEEQKLDFYNHKEQNKVQELRERIMKRREKTKDFIDNKSNKVKEYDNLNKFFTTLITLIFIVAVYKIYQHQPFNKIKQEQNTINKNKVNTNELAKKKYKDVYLSKYNLEPDEKGEMCFTIDKKIVSDRDRSTTELTKKTLDLLVDVTDPTWGKNGWFNVKEDYQTYNNIEYSAKVITNKEFYNKRYNEDFDLYWKEIYNERFPITKCWLYGDDGWKDKYEENKAKMKTLKN